MKLRTMAMIALAVAALAPGLVAAWTSNCAGNICIHCNGDFCVKCNTDTGVCRVF